jgi:hypothetical protein
MPIDRIRGDPRTAYSLRSAEPRRREDPKN